MWADKGGQNASGMSTGGAKETVDYYSPFLTGVIDVPLMVIMMMEEFFFPAMLTKIRTQFFGVLIFCYNFYIGLAEPTLFQSKHL
ncbi:hypothetical protein IT084_17550 [Desulfallas sp. Bu1-1]|nr:hypothetical protein [Desulfallas sp. Bu1-1]